MSINSLLVPNQFKIYGGTVDAPLGTFDNVVIAQTIAVDTVVVDKLIFTDSTKGAMLVADGVDYEPLPVGNDDEILIADTAQPSGVKWSTLDRIQNAAGTSSIVVSTDDTITLNATSHFEIFGETELIHVSTGPDDHCLEIDSNAAGFGDVKAIDIDFITGAIGTGQDLSAVFVNIDDTLATGGDFVGVEIVATEGGADEIIGILAGAKVSPILQLAGLFTDFDTVDDNGVNETVALSTGGAGNVAIFTNDNETLTVGKTVKFEEIEVILRTFASQNINPTFDFSTGVGTWTAFTPADGTNGMRNTGIIIWLDTDIPTWMPGLGAEYLIRITRTRNGLSTTPIADLVKGVAATQYSWDKDGDLDVNDIKCNDIVTVPPATTTPANNGEMTFEATSNTSLTIKYKGSDSVVRSVVLTLA